MGRFHSLRINNIRKETADTVSISLDIPADLKEDYAFIPGQYVTLRTNIFKEEVRRSYSICSAPDSGELRVAIKQIKDGVFSTYANTRLKEGEHLDVGIPEGKFTLQTNIDNRKNYGAFVAGSGITPVLSMVKDVLKHEPKSSFVLLYGNKTPDDTIFHEQLHQLEKEYFGRLFVYYTYTQIHDTHALFGRIDTEKVDYILKNKHKNTFFDSFYLCGPETMIDLVSEKLQENKIKKDQIHYELFTASVKEVAPISASEDFNGSAQVTILVDDEENTITVNENETLLDAALKGGIDAPYSCQGGVCSSCMCMVTEGEVQLLKNSILTDSEIEEGLTLACQAVPKSSIIAIDFDNV